jgi:hypothetical protein
MPRYTITGSALKDDIAALREEIAALKAQAAAREDAAPEPVATVNPLVGKAGEKHKTTRAANVAAQTPKRYCPTHAHGFAFDKKVCPRDASIAIPQDAAAMADAIEALA